MKEEERRKPPPSFLGGAASPGRLLFFWFAFQFFLFFLVGCLGFGSAKQELYSSNLIPHVRRQEWVDSTYS